MRHDAIKGLARRRERIFFGAYLLAVLAHLALSDGYSFLSDTFSSAVKPHYLPLAAATVVLALGALSLHAGFSRLRQDLFSDEEAQSSWALLLALAGFSGWRSSPATAA